MTLGAGRCGGRCGASASVVADVAFVDVAGDAFVLPVRRFGPVVVAGAAFLGAAALVAAFRGLVAVLDVAFFRAGRPEARAEGTTVTGSPPSSGVERRRARSPDARAAPAASAPLGVAISAPDPRRGCAAAPGSPSRPRR